MSVCNHSNKEAFEELGWIRSTGTLKDAEIALCQDCGRVFTRGYPKTIQNLSILNQDFDLSFEVTNARSMEKSTCLGPILARSPGKASTILIDLGGSTGRTAAAFRLDGWKAWSYDPFASMDPDLTEDLFLSETEFNRALHSGEIGDYRGTVVVSMFHVLEHVPEPREFLIDLFNRLPEGGRLLIEVPVIELEPTHIYDPSSFFAPFHATHYSKDILRDDLAHSGWRILEEFAFQDYNGFVVYCGKNPIGANCHYFDPKGPIELVRSYLGRRRNSIDWLGGQISKLVSNKSLTLVWGLGLGFESMYKSLPKIPWSSMIFVDRSPDRCLAFSRNFPEFRPAVGPSEALEIIELSNEKTVNLIPASYAKANEIVDSLKAASRNRFEIKALTYPEIRSY